MNELETLDDAALLAARDTDGRAFALFYRRHLDAVLRWCARRGLDANEAADVTAETFAAAMLSRRRYQPHSGPPRAWLFGIAAHKLADHGRRGARDRRALRRLRIETPALSPRDHCDFAELMAQESASSATEALRELPPAQSAAVAARVIDGASYDAIARNLNVSEAVARQRVSRGLTALRLRLGKEQQ